ALADAQFLRIKTCKILAERTVAHKLLQLGDAGLYGALVLVPTVGFEVGLETTALSQMVEGPPQRMSRQWPVECEGAEVVGGDVGEDTIVSQAVLGRQLLVELEEQ